MNRARLAAGQTASNLLYLALNYYRARSTMGTGGVHRKRLNWMTDLDCSIRNPPPRLRLHARPPPTFSLARVCARVDESTHSRNYYYSCQQKQFFVFLLFLFFFSSVKIFNGWRTLSFPISDRETRYFRSPLATIVSLWCFVTRFDTTRCVDRLWIAIGAW